MPLLQENETTQTNNVGVNERHFYLDHNCKLICEHETSLVSRVMRQLLLPSFGGGPYG